MKKRILSFVAIIVLIGGVALTIWINSNYYFAKKLVYAIKANDIQTVEQILAINPHCVNTYPQTLPERMLNTIGHARGLRYPLIEACRNDNVEIVKALLEAGADPNCSAGFTPLSVTYMCKEENWYPISLLLIEYGASLDYVTEISGKDSAILVDIVCVRSGAASPGYIPENGDEVMSSFCYAIKNCDLNKVNWLWVLQHSISSNRIEIVQFLLEENYCNVNATDSFGWTALMQAACDSTPEMVQLLLDSGADKSYKDSEGKTAYDYAIGKEKDEIALLLAN